MNTLPTVLQSSLFCEDGQRVKMFYLPPSDKTAALVISFGSWETENLRSIAIEGGGKGWVYYPNKEVEGEEFFIFRLWENLGGQATIEKLQHPLPKVLHYLPLKERGEKEREIKV